MGAPKRLGPAPVCGSSEEKMICDINVKTIEGADTGKGTKLEAKKPTIAAYPPGLFQSQAFFFAPPTH